MPIVEPLREIVNAQSLVVLIPVYGNAKRLRATLDSLLETRGAIGFTTVVVDDGSEPPIALDAARYERLGLRLARLPRNQGIVSALNHGLGLARQLGARYVARLDAGDTAHPDRLAKQLAFLEANPDVGIVGSDVLFVDGQGREMFRFEAPRSDAQARRRMHINCSLIHPSVMLRASILDEVGGEYSAHFPAAEDYELFMRILQRSRAGAIPEPLTTSMVSSDGISLARRRAQLRSRLRLQRRFFDARRPESYFGVALTLLFFITPPALVAVAKRATGMTRY
jgi:glycosyltransferase involved in cell wall biosynthesis